jgi:hypothetical protein
MKYRNIKLHLLLIAALVSSLNHGQLAAGQKHLPHDTVDIKKAVVIRSANKHEYCVTLKPGQLLSYSFQSSNELEFNIHYHDGKQVVFEKGPLNSNVIKDEFRASQKANYCWMWSNKTPKKQTLDYKVKLAN